MPGATTPKWKIEDDEADRQKRVEDGGEVLARLRHLHTLYPELRICQIIGNAVPSEEAARRGNDLFYVENSLLLQWLRDFETRLRDQALQAAAERPKP